jgi:hypothetical protein
MSLLFAGGLIISFALLFLSQEGVQAAGGLYLLVELIAVAIFAIRILPAAVRIDWGGAAAARHFAASAVFVIVATAIFLYVIYRFITDPTLTVDPAPVIGILTASDHAAFIGVVTNLMLGLLIVLTADRGDRWPWADQIVFWAMNTGLFVFLVGLFADLVIAKRIGAPLMGLALLLGLATFAMRLWSSDLRAAEEA